MARTAREQGGARTADAPLTPANAPVIADPGPLGLGAFAMTTFVLSVFNAGLLDAKLEAVVLPLALAYGGACQLLAGMWEFRKGNTFGALAFSSFGAFWLAYFFLARYVAAGLGPDAHKAVGLFLLAWTIFTAYMLVASLRVSLAVVVVFALLTLTFLALTIGAFGDKTGITRLGGWLGLLTALAAWYASFAGVTNATWRRDVLPVGPRA